MSKTIVCNPRAQLIAAQNNVRRIILSAICRREVADTYITIGGWPVIHFADGAQIGQLSDQYAVERYNQLAARTLKRLKLEQHLQLLDLDAALEHNEKVEAAALAADEAVD